MEEYGHRFVAKLLWMNGLGRRRIHTKLTAVLGDDCYGLVSIEPHVASLRNSDFSCDDQERPGRPMIDIAASLQASLINLHSLVPI